MATEEECEKKCITEKCKKLWNLRKLITVEPVVICWILPAIMSLVAMENFSLEKTCRVNLGLESDVCDNMINKSLNNIDCTDGDNQLVPLNMTINLDDNFFDLNLKQINATIAGASSGATTFNLNELKMKVCTAENESQKIVAKIYGYRAPIAAIFPIIIILFAGGWSDKKGLRKPCMLLPLIGELLSCVALLISAIFMMELPMEFGGILEKVIPAMTGGLTLMLMGVYSYLTVITDEENRSLRFAIFAAINMIVPTVVYPFSGLLYRKLGYINLFLLCIGIYLVGILYLIFIIKEPQVATTESDNKINETTKNGIDNPGFDTTDGKTASHTNGTESKANGTVTAEKKRNFLVEFFDITLAIDCIKVVFKKRENNQRLILFMLIGGYFTFLAPYMGEGDLNYNYVRRKLNWEGDQFSFFSSYNTGIVLVGTFILIGFFGKVFKMSDALLGIIATIHSIIAKPLTAFATTSLTYYTAATVDLFLGTRAIVMKSIISRNVHTDELGRIYSVLGIMDAFDLFLFPYIYSAIYIDTVDTFPGAIYLFSEIFLIPTLIIFIIVYIIYKRQDKANKDNEESKKPSDDMVDIELNDNYTYAETTHM